MTEKREILRVGFVGAGRVAGRHVQAISKRADAKAVVIADLNLEAAKVLADPCGAEVSSDSEAVLDRPDLDAVYICTPHYLHHPYAVRALKSGKHVFIEKPMANTVGECEEINREARETELVVAIGHHQRYLPSVKRLGELLRDGAVGEVRSITDRVVMDNGWNTRALWWKQKATAGGGLIMNLGVHQVDRSLWLAGKLPQSVFGRVRCGLKELDVDTDYIVVLGMDDSSTINITGSSYPANPDFLLEIIGTEGRLWLNPLENKIYRARSNADIKEEQVDGFMEAIEELAERFILAIREKKTPEVDGAWGEAVGRVVEQACRSSEEGRVMGYTASNQISAPHLQAAS